MKGDETGRDVIRVKPVAVLAPIVPRYLALRAADVVEMRGALAACEMEPVRYIGHKMAGSGGGYGFDMLSELGLRIERAAEEDDAAACARLADELESFLARVEVDYGE